MNKGVTLLRELNSSIAVMIQETDISFDCLKQDISYFIHLLDKIPDYREKTFNIINSNYARQF